MWSEVVVGVKGQQLWVHWPHCHIHGLLQGQAGLTLPSDSPLKSLFLHWITGEVQDSALWKVPREGGIAKCSPGVNNLPFQELDFVWIDSAFPWAVRDAHRIPSEVPGPWGCGTWGSLCSLVHGAFIAASHRPQPGLCEQPGLVPAQVCWLRIMFLYLWLISVGWLSLPCWTSTRMSLRAPLYLKYWCLSWYCRAQRTDMVHSAFFSKAGLKCDR